MFFVVLILTTVLSAILPCVDAHAVHVIIDPLAFVLAAVKPCVGTQSLDLVLLPLAVVPATIVPAVDATAMLLSSKVFALVD